jgi:hypothetical protein
MSPFTPATPVLPETPSPVQGDAEVRCANCGAELAGRYCHRCGQERTASSLRSGYLRKVLTDVVSMDGRALRSLRDLVFRPGFLTREYMAGRRVRHTEPAQLYLLAAAVFFLVNAYRPFISFDTRTRQVDSSLNAVGVVAGISSSAAARLAAQGVSLDVYRERFENVASGCLPPLLLASVLLFAVLLRILHRRAERGAHVVFALHWSAFFLLLMVADRMLPQRHTSSTTLGATIAVLGIVYLAIAVRRVYGRSWLTASLAAIGLKLTFDALIAVWMFAAIGLAFALA